MLLLMNLKLQMSDWHY